jgi:hypothetical protein
MSTTKQQHEILLEEENPLHLKLIEEAEAEVAVEFRNQGTFHSNYMDHPEELQKPTYHAAILVVIPIFMGYAGLFSLQSKLRKRFVNSENDTFQQIFQAATSFLFVGNFLLRLGHNIVFAWMNARARVFASQFAMFTSMSILCVFTWLTKPDTLSDSYLPVVFVAFFLGGVAIGSFEANVLNVLVPLGPSTKLWAIAGMPCGIVTTTVGMFFVLEANGGDLGPVYLIISIAMLFSMVVFNVFIPMPSEKKKSLTIAQFMEDIREWRQWIPPLPFHILAMAFNMFCVSCAIPLTSYLHEGDEDKKVHFWNRKLDHNYFMIIFNFSFSLADLVSRKALYP